MILLVTAGLESAIIDKDMKAHGKTVNPLNDEVKKLTDEITTLKAGLKTAKDELASITDKYDKDQESYKNKYEAEVELRKNAETDLANEKTAHETYRNEVKTQEETAAKQKTFLDAITAYEHKEHGKLNPKQADLVLKGTP